MNRFRSILVATSPGHLNPSTLHGAVKLAHANNARLEVLDVVAPMPAWRRKMNVEGRVVDIQAAMLRDRKDRLRHVLENAGGGFDTEVIETIGEPFIEVIRQVLVEDHDLVVVAEPVAERPHEPRLSSGVMHLLRKCPVPVWVMRSGRSSTGRVLALVDPDPDDPDRDRLNDQIMELATSLASRQGWELHLGHAWALDGEATLRSSPYVALPGEMVDHMVRDTEAARLEHLEALAARHKTELECSIHMVPGVPGVVLPRLAERLDVDLIVMGTVGRTGLRGLIMGNTAETILRSVRCSVLAVKPEGFVTPVKPARGSDRSSDESQ